jgi:hypothetical protein
LIGENRNAGECQNAASAGLGWRCYQPNHWPYHRRRRLQQHLRSAKGQSYPTLDAAQKAGAPTLNIGLFINALINFVIIALVVFWIGKAAVKLIRQEAEAPSAPPAPTRSEVLLEEIRDELRGRTHQ